MSSELKDTLKKRLDENYTAFIESLQGKTASELIAMAPEITAAQQLHEELLDACDEEDMEFLLRFDDPLEVVRGYWESEITGYDHSGEMGHMLWEIRDRELYEKEQLAQAPEDVGGAVQAENLTERKNPMSDVKQINTEDLRHMEGEEGLVLQGCGGDPQEWVDGINRELTEAGILLDGGKLENVVSFRHDGVTCLLFPFGDTELNIGKFAMWRIQTHDRYGGTWLSDYVPNRLGGFLHQPSRQKPTMSLIGMDGNIFAVMGKASSLLKEAGMGDLVSHMVQRVTTCGDYSKALNIISEYVETELSPPAIPQKSNKKKARNTYER